jgi:hypothetical protein
MPSKPIPTKPPLDEKMRTVRVSFTIEGFLEVPVDYTTDQIQSDDVAQAISFDWSYGNGNVKYLGEAPLEKAQLWIASHG